MKFPLLIVSIITFAGVGLSQPQTTPSPYFTIDTGQRTLKAYDDGSLTETRDSKRIMRRISASQMRKIEELIAARPCQNGVSRPAPPRSDVKPSANTTWQIADRDCSVGWAGAGFGLVEVKVTLHYQNSQTGVFPVYFPCSNLSRSGKKRTTEIYPHYMSQSWQRFLRDLTKAAGEGKFLKTLNCPSYWIQ